MQLDFDLAIGGSGVRDEILMVNCIGRVAGIILRGRDARAADLVGLGVGYRGR